MFETLVDKTIPALLSEYSLVTYLLAFAGGVLMSVGPCNLTMIPLIVGYVGGQHEITRRKGFWLSLCFTLGTSLTFVALGVFAAKVGGLFGSRQAILMYGAAGVCLVIGLNLLGVIRLNFDFLTRFQPTRVRRTGSLGALLLGLVMGVTGSQCAVPILAAIVTLVMVKGNMVYGALMLFLYGLGRGVPVVIVGTYTGVLRTLPAMERWTKWAERAAGMIVILIALYLIFQAGQ